MKSCSPTGGVCTMAFQRFVSALVSVLFFQNVNHGSRLWQHYPLSASGWHKCSSSDRTAHMLSGSIVVSRFNPLQQLKWSMLTYLVGMTCGTESSWNAMLTMQWSQYLATGWNGTLQSWYDRVCKVGSFLHGVDVKDDNLRWHAWRHPYQRQQVSKCLGRGNLALSVNSLHCSSWKIRQDERKRAYHVPWHCICHRNLFKDHFWRVKTAQKDNIMSHNIFHIFNEEITESVIEFFATWCRPICHLVSHLWLTRWL